MILKDRIDRLRKFGKSREFIIQSLNDSLCSQTLARKFGETMEDFLRNNPAEKKHHDDLLETIEFVLNGKE